MMNPVYFAVVLTELSFQLTKYQYVKKCSFINCDWFMELFIVCLDSDFSDCKTLLTEYQHESVDL